MKTLYLIDISSFIFRAYYAIPPLTTSTGTPVNAVFGVVSMLHKLITEKSPDHMVVCNDRPEKGFRHDIYRDYKANRPEPPEDLVPQFELIQEYIRTLNIKQLDQEGYEADDIIATIVNKYKTQKDLQIFIVSSDKDLMQLVGENVFVYDTMKDKVFKAPDVMEKFDVPPEKLADLQGLTGDSTDNVPGIAGVGPKTAAKLLKEYGSLKAVLENAKHIKGKLGEKIKSGRESALVSRKLVTLATDIPVDTGWEALVYHKPDTEKLNAFYRKLEFKKFLTGEAEEKKTVSQRSKTNFVLLDDADKLKTAITALTQKKISTFAFDTETDSINPHFARLVGLSFCATSDAAYYVPVAHHGQKNVALKDVQEILGPVLNDDSIPKVAQNAKFDLVVLYRHGIFVNGVTDDTMIASFLVDPSSQHNLDYLAQKYLNHTTIPFSAVVPKKKTFADVSLDKACDYAAEDAWVAFKLIESLKKDLDGAGLLKAYHDVEVPLVPVLTRMELNGVLIDKDHLGTLEEEFSRRIDLLREKIHRLAGEEFNIASPKQLGAILFNKLNLPVVKTTKTGFSTDVEVLEKLSKQHELPRQLLAYRTLSKLLSTYVVQLKNLTHPQSGRVHTSFNQTIAATGRLSSTDPNLQNIPVRTEEGRRIREAFVVPKGALLLSADYSQIELRLLAAFCKDPFLVSAYQNNLDVHAQTAALILGIDVEDVKEAQRTMGKTVNFSVLYGQSPYGLSQQLAVPQSEARHFIENFYKKFERVSKYKDEILLAARKNGFVTTFLGRRRYLPDLRSKNHLARQNAERAAFNTVFQGSAADLIKMAMIAIDRELASKKYKTKMILQVHDELVFEVPKDEIDTVMPLVTHAMENAFELDVPLKVSCRIGKNWAAVG